MIEYSADGLAVEYQGKAIPKGLLDELLDLEVSTSELDTVLGYYRLAKDYEIETVTSSNLPGRDLRGLTLRLWLANWEDSEWIYGDGAIGCRRTDQGLELIPAPEIAAILEAESDGDWHRAEEAARAAGFTGDTRIFSINLDVVSPVELLKPKAESF